MKPLPGWYDDGQLADIVITIVAGIITLVGLLLLLDTAEVAVWDSTAAEYHFGSESMVAHGGEKYRSRTNYVISGVATSAAVIGAGVTSYVVARRLTRKRRPPGRDPTG